MSDEVPSSYRKRVSAVEDQLGRDVCGYPNEEGNPCQQWPVDDEGRCSRHSGGSLEEAFGDDEPSTPPIEPEGHETDSRVDSVRVPSDPQPEGWIESLASSATYWGVLVLVGLLAGAASGAYVFGLPSADGEPTPVEVTIDVNSPDFTKIREHYRNGNLAEVESKLREIYRETPSSSDRAQALYYRYVLQQNRGNHRRAYELAEQFLSDFEDHSLRAEVTFGAWFLADRFLEQEDLAEKHREQLNSEFPDTKWADKTDS